MQVAAAYVRAYKLQRANHKALQMVMKRRHVKREDERERGRENGARGNFEGHKRSMQCKRILKHTHTHKHT